MLEKVSGVVVEIVPLPLTAASLASCAAQVSARFALKGASTAEGRVSFS